MQKKYGLNTTAPLKKFGQNFLTSPAVAQRIVDSAELCPDDTVLEIGPGKGVLTALMAGQCRKVWAVEIDIRLAENLDVVYRQNEKIRIINQDILQFDLSGIVKDSDGSFKVVANLPYNITVPILEKLLAHRSSIESVVVMVQKEMAERFSANSGSKAYGSLSVFIQYYAKVEKLFNVSPGSFFPRPKVTSSVIRIIPYKKLPMTVEKESDFFDFVRLCFSQRRKMLRVVLKQRRNESGNILMKLTNKSGINLMRRAETLSLSEFIKLFEVWDN